MAATGTLGGAATGETKEGGGDLTLICCVNDSTGSIHSYLKSYVDGINEFLGEQKASEEGEAFYNSVVFGGVTRRWSHDAFVPIAEFEPYTADTYYIGGMTALYDAIGEGISNVDAFVGPLVATGRKVNVVVFVQTDGLENSSKEYSQSTVRSLIKDRQDDKGWKFVFIGANQDAVLTGAAMGVSKDTSATYVQNERAMKGVYRAVTENVSAMRSTGGVMPSFSDEQRLEASSAADN